MSFERIGAVLENDKRAFLDDVEKTVRSYIRGTGKQCIAVVEKIPTGRQEADGSPEYRLSKHPVEFNADFIKVLYKSKHPVELNTDFIKVLYKFMRRKTYNGHEIDSTLTKPVLDIIEEKYVALYKKHGDMISTQVVEMLVKDNVLLNSFVTRLEDKIVKDLSKTACAILVLLIVDQIQSAASSTVGTQVAHAAGHQLLHIIASHLAQIIAKFLASTAFHKIMTVVVHKLVIVIITTVILKFLALHIVVAVTASAFMWIVIPIVIIIIAEQIKDFPEKLSKKVSAKVRSHLAKSFQSTNQSVLKAVFDEVVNGEKLLLAVAEDKDVKDMINKLVSDVELPDYY